MERIDTIVVGAGQAGLATSYCLQQAGEEHVVLELGATVAPDWHNERWDSFTTVTPNWGLKLPGMSYAGPDPGGFLTRTEISNLFSRHAARFALPMKLNTPVLSVAPVRARVFWVTTPEPVYFSRSVVISTGYEQPTRIPEASTALPPHLVQLHSTLYRNPEGLPDGAVLVVGSGQSGAQIAEELYQRGRRTFLATSSAERVPRHNRGRDIVEWLVLNGFFGITPEKLPVPKDQFVAPHVSGRDGGRTLNLHQFARDRVTLLGRLEGSEGAKLSYAPDLHQNLTRGDQFAGQVLRMVDDYVGAAGAAAPAEFVTQLRDGFTQVAITHLDLRAEGIATIIWAAGFRHNYRFVQAPVFAADGFPVQERGTTQQPGRSFVGMPSLQTDTLIGLGDAAAHVVSAIHNRPRRSRSTTRVLNARLV